MINISIIIPTYNRPQDLKKTLDSIFLSSHQPNQIIVVDQSSKNETKHLVESYLEQIHTVNYFHLSVPSLANARNFGITKIDKNCDIVVFLDDDVSLKGDCLENLHNYMQSHDNIVGGMFNITTPNRTISMIKKIGFFLLTGSIKFDEQFVTQGGFNAMLLIQPRKEKSIQRCSGCGMFFRKSLIDESFRFPDNFQKYSLMEDVFFSYAAYKKHSNTLIFLPNAKITHYESPIRSVPVKAKIMQNIVHRFLFVKEFGLSYAGYIWTMFVLSMFDALSYKNIKIFTWYIQGMCFVYKNHKLLKLDGSTLDYNAFIFSE